MKEKLSLITSGIAVVFALVLLVTTSVAWFAINKNVNTGGMNMEVESTPNLIISDTIADLQVGKIESRTASTNNSSTTYSAVTFTNDTTFLYPATHYRGANTMKIDEDNYLSEPSSNLVYVTNDEDISQSTGLSTSTIYYDAATSLKHYFDYVVYIASLSSELETPSLTVSLLEVSNICSNFEEYTAFSIDYYLNKNTDTTGTYIGTLNLAGYDNFENDYTTTKESLELVSDASIPLNTEGYLRVTMRCYFDGALLKGNNQAYINSAASISTTSDLLIKSMFSAV